MLDIISTFLQSVQYCFEPYKLSLPIRIYCYTIICVAKICPFVIHMTNF